MRVTHWDVKLAEWAQGRLGQPFVWGQTDCAILSLEAVDVLAGTTLADEHRGRYATERQALRYIRVHSFHLGRWLLAAGLAVIQPGFQQRGDILVADNVWASGHVCLGRRALSSAVNGAVLLADSAAVVAAGCTILRVH